MIAALLLALASDDFETREIASEQIASHMPYSAPIAFLASMSDDAEVQRRGENILRRHALPTWQECVDWSIFVPAVFYDYPDKSGLPFASVSVHKRLGNDAQLRYRFTEWVNANVPNARANLFAFGVRWRDSDECSGLDNLRFMVRGITAWKYYQHHDLAFMANEWAMIKQRGW